MAEILWSNRPCFYLTLFNLFTIYVYSTHFFQVTAESHLQAIELEILKQVILPIFFISIIDIAKLRHSKNCYLGISPRIESGPQIIFFKNVF